MSLRVILITGANGGLGQAIARTFLQESPGNIVWLGVRSNREHADKLAQENPGPLFLRHAGCHLARILAIGGQRNFGAPSAARRAGQQRRQPRRRFAGHDAAGFLAACFGDKSRRRFSRLPGRVADDDQPARRAHCECFLVERAAGSRRPDELRRRQGRRGGR